MTSKERSSWRGSLGKLTSRKSTKTAARKKLSNDIVKYRGVSLETLTEINERILTKDVARGVNLFVLERSVGGVDAGRTLEHTGMKGKVNGTFIARVPYRKERLEVPTSSVTLKERQDWSIEDVCEFFVLPETLKDDSFFLDCIRKSETGEEFQGAFVSQARKSSFSGLVKALQLHYVNKDPTKVFLWIDIFCANQPLLTRKDRGLKDNVQAERWNLLNSGLHQAIDLFEERLIFFNSWDNPYPLQRAWCIWEIYGAARSSKRLDIIFDPSTDHDLLETLSENPGKLLQAISNLDLRKMECHDSKDLDVIKSAVETLEGGFSGLKATITARLREWLIRTVIEIVKRQDKQEGVPGSTSFAALLHYAGTFMLDMNEKEAAFTYYFKSLTIYKEAYGEVHASVAEIYGSIGVVYQNQGKRAEALEIFEKALRIFKDTFGEMHLSVATTYGNIAVILQDEGKFAEAIEMYSKVIKIKKEMLGEQHPSLSKTYNSMGDAYADQRKFDEALKMYRKALKISKAALGERHPSIAEIYINLGSVFISQGNYDEALVTFSMAEHIITETLGDQHPSIARIYENMGTVFECQEKYTEAFELYTKALQIFQKTLGHRHPSVAHTYYNMGSVLEAQGKKADAHSLFGEALSIGKESLGVNHKCTHEYQLSFDRTKESGSLPTLPQQTS